MLTRPTEFNDARLGSFLADEWGLKASKLHSRAVGGGTHHWAALDDNGERFFINVDDLRAKAAPENYGSFFDALSGIAQAIAWMATPMNLRFVVRPLPTRAGSFVQLLDEHFAVTVIPMIDGASDAIDHPNYSTTARRYAVLAAVGRLHAITDNLPAGLVDEDDFVASHEREFNESLSHLDESWCKGPYGERCRALLLENQAGLSALFKRHAALRAQVLKTRDRWVVTHGEPHAANAMFDNERLFLIDWDTMLIAPPERDLRMLLHDESSDLPVYEAAAGSLVLDHAAMELYEAHWDLEEPTGISVGFYRTHDMTEDMEKCWFELLEYVGRLR